MYITGKSVKDIATNMNRDLVILSDWFLANKLSLNISKTNGVLFKPKKNQACGNFCIKLGSEKVTFVSHVRFLGLEVDEYLSWKDHINILCSKLSSSIYILRRLKSTLPIWTKRLLYMSFVNSYLNYGILLWGPMASAKDFGRLFIMQKKSLRLIQNARYNAPTGPIFKEQKILKLVDMVELELSKFMYYFVNQSLPSPLTSLFRTNAQVHGYNTRGRHDASTCLHKTTIFNKSFLTKGPSIWRNLNNKYKSCPSMGSFNTNMKKKLIIY